MYNYQEYSEATLKRVKKQFEDYCEENQINCSDKELDEYSLHVLQIFYSKGGGGGKDEIEAMIPEYFRVLAFKKSQN
ncbi:MAG: hypothetical protein Q4B80_02705 [Aerococcaceae bacterium]|nr:hypothetical protein [Aerococcaceae bacterium]